MDNNNKDIYSANLPFDETAELSILSSIVMNKDALSATVEKLDTNDFYRPDYRLFFEAVKELHNQGGETGDISTIKNKLVEKGCFEQIGGMHFLINVMNAVSNSANIKHYITIVKKYTMLRRLILMSNEITGLCQEGSEPIDNIIEKAEKNILNIIEGRNSEDFNHISDIVSESIRNIENIYNSKGKLTGVPTGFIDFDLKTAGLQKSDLILLAARPSMGKTAFALNIAQNAAIRYNVPVMIFSLEMSKEQLVYRMICSEAMLDAQKIRTGDLEDSDWTALMDGVGTIAGAPIYIDDTSAVTPMEIRSKCRRLKAEKGLGLIVIDYLQLMNGNGRNESRQQEISEISRSLKAIAREVEAPIIALSQLSRACEQRADHRPMLSDLRESGAIEQDADVVSFLYRDEYYFPDTEKPNQAELIIAKQRNGPTGTIDLGWLGKYTKFASLAR